MSNQHSNYVLGIDGGGTKTLARLVNLNTKQVWHAQGGSSSLTNNLNGAITTIADLCKQLIEQAKQVDDSFSEKCVSAVFGLAGAGNEQRVEKLTQVLAINFAQLTICSDARTSAYGANGGKAVAVVALGTGSVGMRLDDHGNSQLVGGWGFIAGDDGSGAKLGLLAVKAAIYEFEINSSEFSPLTQEVLAVIGKTRPEILTWLSNALPCDYAQFSPLVFSLASSCKQAKNIIAQHIQAVESLISLTLNNSNLPLVLLGGVSEATKSFLNEKYQQKLITAKGDALDGACLLAEQFFKS